MIGEVSLDLRNQAGWMTLHEEGEESSDRVRRMGIGYRRKGETYLRIKVQRTIGIASTRMNLCPSCTTTDTNDVRFETRQDLDFNDQYVPRVLP